MRLVLHPKLAGDIREVLDYYRQVGGDELADDFYRELRRQGRARFAFRGGPAETEKSPPAPIRAGGQIGERPRGREPGAGAKRRCGSAVLTSAPRQAVTVCAPKSQ